MMKRFVLVVDRVVHVGMTVLAIFGTLALLITIAAFAFNIQISIFTTGSMEPTIPIGSAAIAKKIPATQVAVGDIVMVDRGTENLSVTHRVVATEPINEYTVSLTMRGDANAVDDPEPYIVNYVHIVLTHYPNAAYVIAWVSNPVFIIFLGTFISFFIGWTLWPRSSKLPIDTKPIDIQHVQ